ncbi:hypothetical protein AVEN_148696-1 [Araneus ventricosus]|uniref:Uncharacterized protein n=1 Tax=Araneus ventricosus TaxID=182803 RepID=A0A4Y2FQ10_ARAVE|nr:hypothetical protein AVEN_148696-1 [Araneus ventricosus]
MLCYLGRCTPPNFSSLLACPTPFRHRNSGTRYTDGRSTHTSGEAAVSEKHLKTVLFSGRGGRVASVLQQISTNIMNTHLCLREQAYWYRLKFGVKHADSS